MNKSISIEVPEGFNEKITKNINDDNIIIEFIPLKEINKENEMKNFLKPFLTNLRITHREDYPNHIFYEQNNEVLFIYSSKKGYFWVDYYKIWSVIYNEFGLNFDEVQEFIKNEVETTLKLNGIIPLSKFYMEFFMGNLI